MKIKCLFLAATILVCGCATFQRKGPQTDIVINPKLISEVQLIYLLAQQTWIATNIDLTSAAPGKLPVFFDEEVVALDAMVTAWKELGRKRGSVADNYASDVTAAVDAGYIREYVWHYKRQDTWEQPPNLRQKEFQSWRSKHLSDHRPPQFGYIFLKQ